jgi:hypothetical protein
MLKRNARLTCPLLIAGAKGWKNSRLFRHVRELGLTEQEIRFLEHIPHEDLPLFYAGAQNISVPFPLRGIRNSTARSNGVGDARCCFKRSAYGGGIGRRQLPPSSVERFAEATIRVLGDEDLRYTMRKRGADRVQAFG